MVELDTHLTYFLNAGLRNGFFDWIMPVFDHNFQWRLPLFAAWLALMIFGGSRGRWVGLGAVAVLILSDVISSALLKPLLGRIRPCNVLPGLYLWRNGAWMTTPDPVLEFYKLSYSFTSSHAANCSGVAFWIGRAYPRAGVTLYVIALLVSFSRVYDGVHWAFDIVGGWGVGLVSFGILYLVIIKTGKPDIFRSGRRAMAGR